jgi:hypothetical protein
MKSFLFLILLIAASGINSQSLRYFQFTTSCGHGKWQDSSFVAATSSQSVIDSVLAEFSRPLANRKFINGKITGGNAGYNHNAGHWFLWHFIPDQWSLVENAIEVCDECPFSDVDSDTTYWFGTVKQFCPWTSRPLKEVSKPMGIIEPAIDKKILLFPNPATDKIEITVQDDPSLFIEIYNATGKKMIDLNLTQGTRIIDLTGFAKGIYFVKIALKNEAILRKLIVG